jgi:hypothetical protein
MLTKRSYKVKLPLMLSVGSLFNPFHIKYGLKFKNDYKLHHPKWVDLLNYRKKGHSVFCIEFLSLDAFSLLRLENTEASRSAEKLLRSNLQIADTTRDFSIEWAERFCIDVKEKAVFCKEIQLRTKLIPDDFLFSVNLRRSKDRLRTLVNASKGLYLATIAFKLSKLVTSVKVEGDAIWIAVPKTYMGSVDKMIASLEFPVSIHRESYDV